jgi:ATP-binding cassette subfamily B protein
MKSLFYLNKYLLKYKYRLIFGLIFIIASNLFAIYPAQIIRDAFDEVKYYLIHNTISDNSLLQKFYHFDNFNSLLLAFGLLVIVLALLKGLFTFLTRQTIIVMSRKIEYDLKNEIFSHYQDLDMLFYKQNNTGDLMNRISEDVSKVRMYLGPGIMYSINLLILFVLVIYTMLTINTKLTIYVLTPLPILSVLIYIVSNRINKQSMRVQKQQSWLSTLAQETFSGIRVLKSFRKEEMINEKMERESNLYKQYSMDLVKTNALFQPLMILLIGLSTILTIYIGGKEAIKGNITVGNIAEFVIYVNMLTWPVTAIGWVTSIIQRAAASQERINEFLNTKPNIINPTSAPFHFNGKITFKNVSFSYPDSNVKALKNISFEVNKGETLAIIGRTGSGKSTLANLIMRMYDAQSGEILIDDKPLKNINLFDYRASAGVVPQEVFLFSDTIANNIAFGCTDFIPTKEQIEQAAKDACVYDNIIQFPDKFDTLLGERGVNLSGGQKQRIGIARAIIKNPSLLLFDDCLSAVDTETEEKILQNLERIMKGKTSIIISHRISSIKNADKIIVLENGEIVEQGTHKELLAAQKQYYELFQKQMSEESY